MYLLYSDETNVDPGKCLFFTYAGISIPGDAASSFSRRIDALRNDAGYRPGELLKFTSNDRPAQVTAEAHREVKRLVIQGAVEHEVRLFASFILHQIATSPEDARRNEINRVCYHFNCYLNRMDESGLVLIDTFKDNLLTRFLREKFSVGLVGMPYSKTLRLDRILGFHVASIGSSNFCSAVDIILGALRYAVNAKDDPSQQAVAKQLLSQVAPLAIRTGSGRVDEISLFFSPKVIKAPTYLRMYEELHEYLAANGMECSQRPIGP
jgi:hypothetical protein